ncbi:MAG: polysaccharide deacetylase family protein [Bacteroidia bacterium]|nr:polysaccharide deacetylase family protein [Bacteroidia bacterium]MCZ2277699.1 polysaccharide deacetylase family protein [Bacteroidia bacterium]
MNGWLNKRFFPCLYPSLTWSIPTSVNEVFLTFDDGPVPEATPFVLDELAKFQAKATFFCIGKNIDSYPDIFERIKAEGHRIGNHTYHHLNGWHTDNKSYFENVKQAQALIGQTDLFRPPYGKIKRSQINFLKQQFRIIMWDILSYDFDKTMRPGECLHKVVDHSSPGSIIVFHDSAKAFPNLKVILPEVLYQLSKRQFSLNVIP